MGILNRNRRSKRQVVRLRRRSYERPSKPEVIVEDSKFNWFDTSFLIAMCTSFGYFMAYSFQKGKYSYYGITEIFINQVDIVTIIIAVTIVAGIVFTVYSLYDNTRAIIKLYPSPITKLLLYPFSPLLIIGMFLMFLLEDFIVIPIILFIILVWIFVSPISQYKEVKGYKNKLQKKVEYIEEEGFTFTNFKYAIKYIPTARVFFIISFFLILNPVVSLIGINDAKTERSYFMLKHNNKEYLVIDEYGDNIIIAPFDKKKNTIKKEFQIIEVKSDFENPIVLENIYLDDKLVIPD